MKAARLWLYRWLSALIPETSCFGLKASLLRWCGAKVGRNVRIGSSARFLGTGALEIGDDVWIGADCFISPIAPAAIAIGSNCDVGPEVMIITGSHEIDPQGDHVAGKGTAASVAIGSGCWLGARTTMLPGVSLAEKTVTAAGAVVTKSCDKPNVLLAGVPASVKKEIMGKGSGPMPKGML